MVSSPATRVPWALVAATCGVAVMAQSASAGLKPDLDTNTLPVVDLTPFFGSTCSDPQAKHTVAQQVVDALERYGMFYATGHSWDADLQAASLEHSRRFFALPEAVKMELAAPTSDPKFVWGYESVGHPQMIPVRARLVAHHTSFSYGPESPARSSANRWPSQEVEATLGGAAWRHGLLEACAHGSEALFAAADALSAGRGWDAVWDLSERLRGANTTIGVQALRYEPYDAVRRARELGGDAAAAAAAVTVFEPHRDTGLLTVIAQDDLGGLQRWVPAAATGAAADASGGNTTAAGPACFLAHDRRAASTDGPICTMSGVPLHGPDPEEAGGGAWVAVAPPRGGAVVVLAGLTAELLSGGRVRAPLHRVTLRGAARRYSLALSANPLDGLDMLRELRVRAGAEEPLAALEAFLEGIDDEDGGDCGGGGGGEGTCASS